MPRLVVRTLAGGIHHVGVDDSAEEDNEEELLIADPRAYRPKWGRREVLTVLALLLGWYSVSTSALITNKLILKIRHFEFPFSVAFLYVRPCTTTLEMHPL